ncbi:MAG: HEAT repeat domain-containing protein [Bryobacteraceae bacterium]|nr:HEAT repeat domain-containing protein [Bryobacteraceae bacterium]
MSCETVRDNLSLYLYGELSFEEEESVEQHLESCRDCARALEREKQIHRSLDIAAVAPTQELLEGCRLALPRAILHSAPGRSSWRQSVRVFLARPVASAAWLKPVGAVALVALGFFAARLASPPAGLPGEPDNVSRRVRFVEPSDSGGIRLVVDETRQRVLDGDIQDEAIRHLLLAAVRDPADPGIRAESLDVLKSHPGAADLREALLYVVQHDPNAGVRLKALEALKPYAADPESREALSGVLLNDENPGIRAMTIDYLTASGGPDVVGALQEAMRKEENSYVRYRSQKALREMKASLQTF